MKEVKIVSNDYFKEAFTDALCSRGIYVGDLNDAPSGIFVVRREYANANHYPIDRSGILLSCSGLCSFQLFFHEESIAVFFRIKWYSNNWNEWNEIQMSDHAGSLTETFQGGGKRFCFNALRSFAERRVA